MNWERKNTMKAHSIYLPLRIRKGILNKNHSTGGTHLAWVPLARLNNN